MRKTEVDNCFAEWKFGDQRQVALQCVTWWLFTLHFCFKPEIHPDVFNGATSHNENDPEWGNEILLWKAKRATKDSHGLDKFSGRWLFYYTSQTIDHERCPVKYYKTFKSHHPAEMNKPESSFYFTNKHHQNPGDIIWYKKSPLRKNEVGKLLLKAAQSNSVRRICISKLLDSDVPVIV